MQVDRFNRLHLCSAVILSLAGALSSSIWEIGEPLAVIAGSIFSLVNASLYGKLVQGIVQQSNNLYFFIVASLKLIVPILLIYLLSRQSQEFVYSGLVGAMAFVPAAIYVGVIGYMETEP